MIMPIELLLSVVLSIAQGPPRDAAAGRPVATPSGTASISGTIVTDDADRRPVRRARVTVTNTERPTGSTIITDDSGAFAFRNLPAGRYMLSVAKNAWVGTSYGAARPGSAGTPVVVKDGEVLGPITLRLARGAVITGVVTDEAGRPLPRTGVMPFRFAYQNGMRTLIPAGMTSLSDDRGVYRLYGLPPGQYVVGTSPRGPSMGPSAGEIRLTTDADIQRALSERGQRRPGGPIPPESRTGTVAYAPVFYPGTSISSQASILTVAAGEERSTVDFSVALVPTSRVEGMVVLPEGGVPSNVSVNIIASEAGVGGLGMSTFRVGRPMPDGRFTFAGMPPGRYTIVSRGSLPGEAPPAGPPGRPGEMSTPGLWAVSDVVLDGHNVSGITLALQPGFTVSGRVEFSGALPRPEATRLRVMLSPVQMPGQVNVGAAPASVNADGTFTIGGVAPGQYRANSTIPGTRPDQPGWSLRSAVANGRDILDAPIELRQNLSDLVLTFSDRTTELSGSLQDSSARAAPDYTIVVFSADRAHWIPQSRRVRMIRPSADGAFTLRHLPPGDYLIAALTDLEDGAWTDPSVLQQLAPASIKITLNEGEKKTQHIQVGAK